MSDSSYANDYRNIDFRKHPERYKIGRGEQGVLLAEPYKSEILPHWKFVTVAAATASAQKIYALFCEYAENNDFVGMDMARKFLQMGFTRSRRYANHTNGTKHTESGALRPQASDWASSEKAQAAQIFYEQYLRAKNDPHYQALKQQHTAAQKNT